MGANVPFMMGLVLLAMMLSVSVRFLETVTLLDD
jgi:hypothetical protein